MKAELLDMAVDYNPAEENKLDPAPEEATNKPNQNPFYIPTMRELMSQDIPLPDFLVKGMILPGLICYSGKPKVGKTTLLIQLGLCVASGSPFLGHNVKQGGCLFYGLEGSRGGFIERCRRMQDLLEIPDTVYDSFRYINKLHKSGGKDVEGTLIGSLTKTLDAHHEQDIKLIVLDTWLLCRDPSSGYGDAHDKAYAQLAPLASFALENKLTIIYTQHMNKDSRAEGDNRISGAGAYQATAEQVITVDCPDKDTRGKFIPDRQILNFTNRELDNFQLNVEFVKSSQPGDNRRSYGIYQINESTIDDEANNTRETQEEVLTLLEKQGRMSAGDMAKALGVSRQVIHGRMKALVNKGAASKEQSNGNCFYKLVQSTQTTLTPLH